jgi:hypothetical protein
MHGGATDPDTRAQRTEDRRGGVTGPTGPTGRTGPGGASCRGRAAARPGAAR